MKLTKIAVTGASGFIGRAFIARASVLGHPVRAILRMAPAIPIVSAEIVCVGTDYSKADDGIFDGCDIVVNFAARVHVTRDNPRDSADENRRINRDMAVQIAEAARRAGAARFLQMSSVAAICSTTPPGKLADDFTPPRPENDYGVSKLEADTMLLRLSGPSFSVISLRPPTVYGPGVRAYFAQIMKAAKRGLPLPIARVNNLRSFIFVENLADACLSSCWARAEGEYVVTDSEPCSTADLYRSLCDAYGRRPWLPPIPAFAVRSAASALIGKRADSLLGSSAFDGSRFCRDIGWAPRFSMQEALKRTVESDR